MYYVAENKLSLQETFRKGRERTQPIPEKSMKYLDERVKKERIVIIMRLPDEKIEHLKRNLEKELDIGYQTREGKKEGEKRKEVRFTCNILLETKIHDHHRGQKANQWANLRSNLPKLHH